MEVCLGDHSCHCIMYKCVAWFVSDSLLSYFICFIISVLVISSVTYVILARVISSQFFYIYFL